MCIVGVCSVYVDVNDHNTVYVRETSSHDARGAGGRQKIIMAYRRRQLSRRPWWPHRASSGVAYNIYARANTNARDHREHVSPTRAPVGGEYARVLCGSRAHAPAVRRRGGIPVRVISEESERETNSAEVVLSAGPAAGQPAADRTGRAVFTCRTRCTVYPAVGAVKSFSFPFFHVDIMTCACHVAELRVRDIRFWCT